MNPLISLLVATMPVTSDHTCWMFADGHMIDLGYLCGEEAPPVTVRATQPAAGVGPEEAFLADLRRGGMSPLATYVMESDPELALELATMYCVARQEGISETEFSAAFQEGAAIGLGEQEFSTSEATLIAGTTSEFYEVIVTKAPNYFCPEFSQR